MSAGVPYSGGERRREARFDVMLDAKLRIPLDHAGNAILAAKSTIENLSRSGAHVHIHALSKGHAPVLVEACRKCSLICPLPEGGVPLYLSGEISWMDVCGDDPQPDARLGVRLTETAPEEGERLARFLDRLTAKG